jgi:Ni/Co efflux regulator RcnB
MKKILSSIVAALVAVSFAGIVCAAEPANSETKTESTTVNAAGAKVEKKEVKKKKTTKKGKKVKKTVKKEETVTAPAAAPAPAAK